jgi:hypothetical protein
MNWLIDISKSVWEWLISGNTDERKEKIISSAAATNAEWEKLLEEAKEQIKDLRDLHKESLIRIGALEDKEDECEKRFDEQRVQIRQLEIENHKLRIEINELRFELQSLKDSY